MLLNKTACEELNKSVIALITLGAQIVCGVMGVYTQSGIQKTAGTVP